MYCNYGYLLCFMFDSFVTDLYYLSAGFLELSLPLQVQMLECCWLEVLMLGLMWRSVDHPGKLIFSPDLKLNRYVAVCARSAGEVLLKLSPPTSKGV